MSRSILSQIFSGLGYAAGGLFALSVLFSVLPSPCFPKELMPPAEGFILKDVWTALFIYAGEHDFQYPKDLQSIANSEVFSNRDPKRLKFLSSPNLKYFPPLKPIRNPYSEEDSQATLLTYETDQWFFSISVGSEIKHFRKKIGTNTQQGPASRSMPPRGKPLSETAF